VPKLGCRPLAFPSLVEPAAERKIPGESRDAINGQDLHRWRDKYGGAVRVSASIPETPEQEIKRLRKEVERLRMEREILKKAEAFFAKENT